MSGHLKRMTTNGGHGQAVGQGRRNPGGNRLPRPQRRDVRRREFRLHAVDRDVRLQRLHGARHAGDQARSADGYHDRIDARYVLDDFHADGARPRDYRRIVVSVDIFQAATLAGGYEFFGVFFGFSNVRSLDDYFGAEFSAPVNLRQGRNCRHHDRHGNSQILPVIRQRERMIAGARRDHASRSPQLVLPHLSQQRQYGIPRPPFLERSRELLKFRLQEDVRAEELGEEVGFYAGRANDAVADGDVGTGDVGEGYGEGFEVRLLALFRMCLPSRSREGVRIVLVFDDAAALGRTDTAAVVIVVFVGTACAGERKIRRGDYWIGEARRRGYPGVD
mmetsp:Transcript_13612/g.32953  ORF Transcript_13612/g.32953 Transcript_13612/m.32953 type:complete len:334 (+) Transcript_13612:207-1208(+)